MASQTPVGVSDLVRAMQQLAPQDNPARRSIAQMLGFGWQEIAATAAGADATATTGQEGSGATVKIVPQPASVQGTAQIGSVAVGTVSPAPAPTHGSAAHQPAADPTAADQLFASTLFELPPRPLVFPVAALEQAPEDQPPVLPFEPLLRPTWTRAILAHALATVDWQGPLDVPRLIDWLAQGKAITALPRLPWPTLVRGVQLLLDLSEALLPYRKDQLWLATQVEKIVGPDKVTVLQFAASPHRCGNGPPDEWRAYQPPAHGTPVLAVTDLGVGRPARRVDYADRADWLQLATMLQKAGCPLLVFTPYPRDRHAGLTGRFPIVPWDRTTTAALIRRLVGKGHAIS